MTSRIASLMLLQVLATACGSGDDAAILIEVGPLRFEPLGRLPAGDHPTSAVAADLDGDGDPDVIVSSFWTEQLIVFENQGGVLAHALDVPLIGYPGDLIAAELDGEPGLEIGAIRAVASEVSFFRPDPERWLVPGPPALELREPSSIEVVDLDGDGQNELLGGRFSPGQVRLARRGETGYGVEMEGDAPEGAVAMAAADLDGDGVPEIAVVGAKTDEVAVLGRDLAPRTTAPAPTWPNDVIAADLDGDGGPVELIVAGNLGDQVAIYVGRGTGAGLTLERRATLEVGSGPICTHAVDLDGDGRLELIVAEKTGFALSIWSGPWDAPVRLGALPTGDGPTPIVMVDLDRDGRDDVVTVDAFSNEVEAWLAR